MNVKIVDGKCHRSRLTTEVHLQTDSHADKVTSALNLSFGFDFVCVVYVACFIGDCKSNDSLDKVECCFDIVAGVDGT